MIDMHNIHPCIYIQIRFVLYMADSERLKIKSITDNQPNSLLIHYLFISVEVQALWNGVFE